MKINPKIPKKLPLVEEAISSGKYLVCPDSDVEYPKIHEPNFNPNRDDQVVHWVPGQFSYQLPDGGAYFCEMLQSGDPSTPWAVSDQEEIEEDV